MKKLMYKFSGLVAGLVLTITALNVNSACNFIVHQPKLPEGAEQLSKIN